MQNLKPAKNESEFDFTKRAHAELRSKVPDYAERNSLVWDLWDKYGVPSRFDAIVKRCLPSDRYVPLEGATCYFREHESQGPDGKPRKYGFDELKQIAANCNEDILEHSQLAAISKGHTSDNPNDAEPPVLGFTPRFRMGMVGLEKPLWAIFGNEYVKKDKAGELAELPGRSVELLTERSSGRKRFFPIAALGSTAPRLSMPGRYSSNEVAEKYSFATAGAMMPGASNTSLPSDKFSGEGSMLSNDDIRQMVEAFMMTPQMQWVTAQMSATGAPIAGGPPAPGMAPPMAPPMGADPMAGGAPPDAPPGGDSGGDDTPPADDNKFMDPAYVERFKAHQDLVEKYNALDGQYKNLIQKFGEQQNQIAVLSNAKADVERKAAINDLCQKYQGIIVAEEEFQRCLFSAGSTMTTEQFKNHCETIERYAQRSQLASVGSLPSGVLPSTQTDKMVEYSSEKFRALSDRAVELHTADINNGRPVKEWDEYLKAAAAN